jgi:hypothetical protein
MPQMNLPIHSIQKLQIMGGEMDIEFHYWVTGLVAEYAGFKDDESQIIAYSSQLLC